MSVVGRESGRGRAKIRAKEKKIWEGVSVYIVVWERVNLEGVSYSWRRESWREGWRDSGPG